MAIEGKFFNNGTRFFDNEDMTVKTSIGENNTTSNFTANFPNYNGQHKNDFTIGDTVEIYTNSQKIFQGLVEEISFDGKPNNEMITLTGRDLSQKLINTTIEPIVYTNQEISTIVISLMTAIPDITTTNVNVTTTTLSYIAYNHTSVFDALKQLAELANFYFYVDPDGDLHFEQKSIIDSGYILNNHNVVKAKFRESDKELANNIWVYGDRVLTAAPTETFTSTGGSSYELKYKPHNTKVTYDGSIYKGGIFNLLSSQPSGVQYLVDYDNKKIVTISGTLAGDHNIPSGSNFTVEYDRSAPVIKFVSDNTSINTYGNKDKVIVNKEIKEPLLAREIALRELRENKNPKKEGNISLVGVAYLVPGNTITVDLPNHDINSQIYDILEVTYQLNSKTFQNEKVITVKVSKKLKNVVDTIKQLINDVKEIQAQDAIDSEFISRLETDNPQVQPRIRSWFIRTRDPGSSFILGHSEKGILGVVPAGSVQPVLGSGTVGSYITVGSYFNPESTIPSRFPMTFPIIFDA